MAKPRLLFLPTGGVGHLLSMVEMAKRFFHHHRGEPESHFSITILVPGSKSPEVDHYIQSVAATGLDVEFEELPPVERPSHIDDVEDFISRSMESYKPDVKSAISRHLSSSVTVAALIVDFFASAVIDAAHELNIPSYIYFTSGALMLALMLHLPTLEKKFPMEFEEVEGVMEVPGMSPVPPLSLPTPFMNKKKRGYSWFVYHGRKFCEAKGLIVNTFAELEPLPLQAIAEGKCVPDHSTPPVYPVGPILALKESGTEQHECLTWLDNQPTESVVFLCFGSHGCFKMPQVKDMALGLERSGHRFLWALRVSLSDTPWMPEDANLEEVLPEGFLERTKGRGLVWPSWAPQVEVLAHPAIGGFVTHCGWNSTLESLWFGVPMLGWPLYAEQHFNAFMMAKDLGVALEMKIDRKGGNFVAAEELERGVRCLMEESEEGNKVRAKVKEMKSISRKAMKEGGSSYAYMEELVKALRQKDS